MSIDYNLGFPGGSDCKEFACNAGDPGLVPGLGRSPGRGHGNPLQYSCLENSMGRGAWRATVHGTTKSKTWLSNLYTHTPAGSQGRGDTGVGNPGPWSRLLALWGLPSLLLFQPGVSGFHLREVISFLCLVPNQCQPIAVTILGVSSLHLLLLPLPNPSS